MPFFFVVGIDFCAVNVFIAIDIGLNPKIKHKKTPDLYHLTLYSAALIADVPQNGILCSDIWRLFPNIFCFFYYTLYLKLQ